MCIRDRFYEDTMLSNYSTDSQAETYEDRYYQILEWLYFTYCCQRIKEEKSKDKSRKKAKTKISKAKKKVAKKLKTPKIKNKKEKNDKKG